MADDVLLDELAEQARVHVAEDRYDESPDDGQRHQSRLLAGPRRQSTHRPERQDEGQTQQHVDGNQRQGVAGPEEQAQDDHDRAKNADQRLRDDERDAHCDSLLRCEVYLQDGTCLSPPDDGDVTEA